VGAELLHADGRTDKTKLTVAFSNFTKQTKNCSFQCFKGTQHRV